MKRTIKLVDQMDDKIYFAANGFGLVDKVASTGFRIDPSINDEGVLEGANVKSVGIGNCVDEATLIFLFEDGEKFKSTAWSGFDCEGISYFTFSKEQLEKLSSTKLKTIRFTNGHSFESQTSDVPEEHKDCFIEVAKELKDKTYKVVIE